jgi:hypothetical protein
MLTTQPLGRTNNAGTTAAFTVNATGTPPFSFQWQKDGVALTDGGNVSGTKSATLTVSNLLKADEGVYRFVVTNAAGFAVSDEARLIVIDPVIVIQPEDCIGIPEFSATFAVVGAGTALQYQWQRNSTNLAGATHASLVVSNLSGLDDGGIYRVVVSNAFGSVISSNATLSLDWSLRFIKSTLNSHGLFQARLVAPPGSNVIFQDWHEGSPWTSFATNSAANGIIEITTPMIQPDTNGALPAVRFYRARLAP